MILLVEFIDQVIISGCGFFVFLCFILDLTFGHLLFLLVRLLFAGHYESAVFELFDASVDTHAKDEHEYQTQK